jgi:hypothetical protein
MKKNEEFKLKVNEIQEVQIDFVESKLFENIKNNCVPSILFYLKCKGKHRGYIEKSELTVTIEDITVRIKEPTILIDTNDITKPED